MTALLTDNLSLLAGAPNGIKKLRELILELAVRGKLVPQDPSDEPASELLKRIAKEKAAKEQGAKKASQQTSGSTGESERFDLPEAWCWVRFGDVAQHNSGKTLDKGRNTGVARDYITTSNLYWGRFELENVRQMLIEESELTRCTAIKNDLLICEGGEAGRAAVWGQDREICFQNHVHRARFLGDICPYYIQRYFERLNYSGEIAQYRKGVGISNMSSKALASIPLPLPPLAEQHRIVAKVDELMALCDRLEARQADAESAHARLVQALLDSLTQANDAADFAASWKRLSTHFHSLFTSESSIDALKQTLLQLAVMGKLVPQDPSDEPASKFIRRIAEEKARLVAEGKAKKLKSKTVISQEERPFEEPNGWSWVRLEELARVITKGSSPKWQGISYTNNPDDVLFVTSENVGSYKLRLDSKKYVEKSFNSIEPRSILEKGDFLMNIVGASIGRTAIFDVDVNANINQAVCLIRIFPELTDSQYLLHFFNSETCLCYMFDKQVDNARANLSMGNISNFALPLPPLAEQHRIVAKLDQLMALCDQLKARLADARQLHERLAGTLVEQAVA